MRTRRILRIALAVAFLALLAAAVAPLVPFAAPAAVAWSGPVAAAVGAIALAVAEIWPEVASMMAGCVVVGHNIAFDIAHLRRATAAAGAAWSPPRTLDTLLLAAALDPAGGSLELEALAGRFGVGVRGRHTAFGDCLVTAEIYARMLPLLADRGVRTLAEAEAFQATQRHIVRAQRRAGWHGVPARPASEGPC